MALRQTNLPLRTFPEDCPYLFDDAITDNLLCDTGQDWENNLYHFSLLVNQIRSKTEGIHQYRTQQMELCYILLMAF